MADYFKLEVSAFRLRTNSGCFYFSVLLFPPKGGAVAESVERFLLLDMHRWMDGAMDGFMQKLGNVHNNNQLSTFLASCGTHIQMGREPEESAQSQSQI